jgi:hypothetical protein
MNLLSHTKEACHIYSLHVTGKVMLTGNWAPRREGIW